MSMADQNGTEFGIDISHHNGVINYTKVAENGIKFIFIKATEGSTFVDPKFVTNYLGFKNTGVELGAYHFFRPGTSSPRTQAENLKNTLAKVNYFTDLKKPRIALDLEVNDNIDPVQLTTNLAYFMRNASSLLEIRQEDIIIYTGKYFWEANISQNYDFTNHTLWVAHWTNNSVPNLPTGFKNWTYWQYSSRGHVDGIRGFVDLNRKKLIN